MSIQRIEGSSALQNRERDLEQPEVPEARESLIELFDLLEEYAPRWYTEKHHARALAAIRALQEF